MTVTPHSFAYVATDVPEGLTLREWRAQQPRARRWSWRTFLKGLIGSGWKA